MGTEYGLFDDEKKEFLWLGKRLAERGFEVLPDVLHRFLSSRLVRTGGSSFRIVPDIHDCRTDFVKDGWREVPDAAP